MKEAKSAPGLRGRDEQYPGVAAARALPYTFSRRGSGRVKTKDRPMGRLQWVHARGYGRWVVRAARYITGYPHYEDSWAAFQAVCMRLQPGRIGALPEEMREYDSGDAGVDPSDVDELTRHTIRGLFYAMPELHTGWTVTVELFERRATSRRDPVRYAGVRGCCHIQPKEFACEIPLAEFACKSERSLQKIHARIAATIPRYSAEVRRGAVGRTMPAVVEIVSNLDEMEAYAGILNVEDQLDEIRYQVERLSGDLEEIGETGMLGDDAVAEED